MLGNQHDKENSCRYWYWLSPKLILCHSLSLRDSPCHSLSLSLILSVTPSLPHSFTPLLLSPSLISSLPPLLALPSSLYLPISPFLCPFLSCFFSLSSFLSPYLPLPSVLFFSLSSPPLSSFLSVYHSFFLSLYLYLSHHLSLSLSPISIIPSRPSLSPVSSLSLSFPLPVSFSLLISTCSLDLPID